MFVLFILSATAKVVTGDHSSDSKQWTPEEICSADSVSHVQTFKGNIKLL